MVKEYRSYGEFILDDLEDPHMCVEYLTACLLEDDINIFRLAVEDIYNAHFENGERKE